MTINLILFICFFPLLPIVYFLLRNETKAKKNIVLGVTLPYEARQGEQVAAVCKRYRRSLTAASIPLALIPCSIFILQTFSAVFNLLMAWLIAVPAVSYFIFIRYHQKLRRLKFQNGWGMRAIQADAVDLKAAASPQKRVSLWWYFPPLLLSLTPVADLILERPEAAAFWPAMIGYACNLLVTGFMLLLGRVVYHQKSDTVDEDTSLTIALTRVRRYNWSKCWIFLSWVTGLFSLCFWIFQNNAAGLLTSAVVYNFFVLFFVLRVEFVTRTAQQKLTKDSGRAVFTDDDGHWIYGLFYYNPNDTHVLVNNRTGIGTTLNLGRPVGKAVTLVSLLLVLSLPALGGWLAVEEKTPVTAVVSESSLTVSHTKKVLELPLQGIADAELLEQLPSASKVVGTNFPNLYKGTFDVKGIGVCKLYLNPQAGPFLKLQTTQGVYIINTESRADTIALYQALTSQK